MEKIASFTVNHLDLLPGVYVSRKDHVGQEVLTTFDLRMCAPNREPVMNTAELHTIEHLAATYLRNRINGATASKYREDGDEYDLKCATPPNTVPVLKVSRTYWYTMPKARASVSRIWERWWNVLLRLLSSVRTVNVS